MCHWEFSEVCLGKVCVIGSSLRFALVKCVSLGFSEVCFGTVCHWEFSEVCLGKVCHWEFSEVCLGKVCVIGVL